AKVYDRAPPAAGSSTTIALWPKRSKKISPGCMVATPMRGAACAGSQATHSSTSAASQARRATAATRAARAPAPASVAMDGQVEGVQAAGVGARHAEAEAPEAQLLAGLREVADGGGHQAADGVVLV